MKKALAVLAIFAFTGVLRADPRKTVAGEEYPQRPNMIASEAVYQSSVSCAGNLFNGAAVVISTRAALLYAVNVTSAGQINSGVQFFDSKISTGTTSGAVTSSTLAPAITPAIDANTKQPWTFNIATSSGLSWAIYGTVPPCVQVSYVER